MLPAQLALLILSDSFPPPPSLSSATTPTVSDTYGATLARPGIGPSSSLALMLLMLTLDLVFYLRFNWRLCRNFIFLKMTLVLTPATFIIVVTASPLHLIRLIPDSVPSVSNTLA
jgi:hypothetical protein